MKPAAPNVTADDTANTVAGFDAATMEAALSIDNGASYGAYETRLPAPADLSGDRKLKVRVKAVGITPAGLDTELSFTMNPAAPVARDLFIGGNTSVGGTLNGIYVYSDINHDPEGKSTFRWYRNGTAIDGAQAKTYTLVDADMGKTIRFEVTPVSTKEPFVGTAVALDIYLGSDPFAPTASAVSISGTAQVGQILTGSYTYADANRDAEGRSTFNWLRNSEVIAGAYAKTYTLVADDKGSTITFVVTPVSTVEPTAGKPVASSPTAAVTVLPSAPTASAVSISGTAQVGQTLTGSYTYADANGDPQGTSTFRWLRNGTAIEFATAKTYTLVAADQGTTIAFEVTPVSTVAPMNGTAVVSSPTANVAGVGVPVAPTASAVTIYGMAQVGQTLTGIYTYADANGDPQGTSTFSWLRNGKVITGAYEKTYTLVAADLGTTITFEVKPVSTAAPMNGTAVVSNATTAVTLADITPDAFRFVDQTGVALSTLIESAPITVAGINAASPISITGGEYSINDGAYTSAAGTVANGVRVKVRHTSSAGNSSAINSGATDTVLTIGSVSDTFTSTTVGLPPGYVHLPIAGGGVLTWTPNNVNGNANWDHADAYCRGTRLNGQDGWRLPTDDELSTLYYAKWGSKVDLSGWALTLTWTSYQSDKAHAAYNLGWPPGTVSPTGVSMYQLRGSAEPWAFSCVRPLAP